jgi:hypothetical protein
MNNTFSRNGMITVLLTAIFVGAVYVCPDIWFLKKAGPEYKAIAPVGFIDETLYLGRLNAVSKGDTELRNPAIYEHRRDPVIMPGLSEMIEAGAGRIFGLGLAKLDMAATFILPAVLFLLIALLAYEISSSAPGSAIAALTVLFGTHLFSRAFLFSGKIFSSSYDLPLWFARPITPQMHFIFFVAVLAAVYKALIDNRIIFVVLAGFLLGALFYVSVFYWVYIYALLGVLFVFLMFEKDYSSIIKIVFMSVVACLISVPYWLENLKTMAHPNYGTLLYRFNIAFTHKPIAPVSAIAVLALVISARKAIIGQGGKKAFYFLSSLMLAVLLTLNQQVFTGKLFKQSHWTTYTGKFAIIVTALIAITFLARSFYGRNKALTNISRVAAVSFCALLAIHAIGMQAKYCVKHFGCNMRLQKMAGVFNWLSKHTSPDDVILPSPNDVTLSEQIPIYTRNFVYYSEPFLCLSLASFDETRYRMLASYKLFGYTIDDAKRHPYAWDGAVFLTSDTNRDGSFVAAEKEKFEKEYSSMSAADGLKLARKYKVDYVLADDEKDGAVIKNLSESGFKKVYDDGRYSLIRVGGTDG